MMFHFVLLCEQGISIQTIINLFNYYYSIIPNACASVLLSSLIMKKIFNEECSIIITTTHIPQC